MPPSNWVQVREKAGKIEIIGRAGKKSHLVPPTILLLGIFLVARDESSDLLFGLGILSFIASIFIGVIVLSTTNVDIYQQTSVIDTYIKYFGIFGSSHNEYDLEKVHTIVLDYSGVSGRKNVSDQYFTLFFEDVRSNHALLWGNPTQLWFAAIRLREILRIPIHIKIAHPDKYIDVDQFEIEWLPEQRVEPNPSLLKGTLNDSPEKRVITFKVSSIPGLLALIFIFSPVLYYSYRILSSDELFATSAVEGFVTIFIAVVVLMLFTSSAILNFSPGYIELTPNSIGIGVRVLRIPIFKKVELKDLIHCFVTDKIKSGHRIFLLSTHKGLMSVQIADLVQAKLIMNLVYQFYQSI